MLVPPLKCFILFACPRTWSDCDLEVVRSGEREANMWLINSTM